MSSLAADAAQSGFQGWYILNESPEAIVCKPGYFTTSGSYAACATHASTSTSFTWNTGCDGSNTLLFQNGGGDICVSGASCLGMTIFQTSPYGMPVVTQFECVTNWIASTLYRELDNEFETSSSVKTVAPAETSQTMHTPLATSTTTTQSSSTATTTSSKDNSSQPASSGPASSGPVSSGLSGGAIAGIVVGCLAGGFILACIFFFRKRIAAAISRKREPGAQYYDPSYYGRHPQPQIPGAVSEMSSERAPVELQGAHIVRELDGVNSAPKHYA